MDPESTPAADGPALSDSTPPVRDGPSGPPPTQSPAPARRPRRRTLIAAAAGIALVAVATIGLSVTRPWAGHPACAATVADAHPDWSVARRWDEALLDA